MRIIDFMSIPRGDPKNLFVFKPVTPPDISTIPTQQIKER